MLYELMQPSSRSLSRLFDGFDGFLGDLPLGFGSQTMRVDAQETDDAVIVTADVPGVKKDDLTIEVSDGMLSLSVQQNVMQEDRQEGFLCRERQVGNLSRVMRIPATVDEDAVTASLKAGVLTVEMKKIEAKKAKSVEIRVL